MAKKTIKQLEGEIADLQDEVKAEGERVLVARTERSRALDELKEEREQNNRLRDELAATTRERDEMRGYIRRSDELRQQPPVPRFGHYEHAPNQAEDFSVHRYMGSAECTRPWYHR